MTRSALLALAALVGSVHAAPVQEDEPLEATVALEVVDEAGRPVVGAQVLLEPILDPSGGDVLVAMDEPAVTNARGLAWVGIPAGADRVLIVFGKGERKNHPERVSVPALKPGEGREMRVVLETRSDGSFRGRLVDAEGRPVRGAQVHVETDANVFPRDDLRIVGQPTGSTETDADGRFEVRAASWKSTSLRIHVPGFAPRRVQVGAGGLAVDADAPVEVQVERGASFDVGVTGREGTVVVKVSAFKSCLDPRVPFSLQNDWGRVEFFAEERDGRYVVEDLPAGATMKLVVEVDGRVVRRLAGICSPEPGAARRIDLDLSRSRGIEGRVVGPDGRPVEGVALWLAADGDYTRGRFHARTELSGRGMSGEDGRFSFTDLIPGVYRLGLASPSRNGDRPTYAAVMSIVDATAGDPEPVEIVVHSGVTIGGRILAPGGGAGTATISAYCPDTGHAMYTQEPCSGEFEIGPLMPGRYRVRASVRGSGSTAVVAEAGATDVELQLRGAGSVVGRVVDGRSGKPRRAAVSFVGLDEESYMSTTTKEDGVARTGGLLPGPHVISARARGGFVGASRIVDVEPGEEVDSGEIRLVPGALVRVVCEDRRGNTLVRVRHADGFTALDNIAAPGHLDLYVPPGAITVSVSRPGSADETVRTFEVLVGGLNRCVVDERR